MDRYASAMQPNLTEDRTKTDADEISATEFVSIVEEVRQEPAWRRRANEEADYYDGNQIDQATLAEMEALGIAPSIENLIAPTIDSVLGLEVKTRTDWVVKPAKDKRWQDVADALSVKLNEAERETRADRACSDAYAPQIKVGLGWVGVSRSQNPFEYPYRVEYIHRNEVFWDWRSQKPDLSDARFLVRKKWYDAKTIGLMFPDRKELIGAAASNLDDLTLFASYGTDLAGDAGDPRSWPWDEEWRDYAGRMCLYEAWYRRWVRGLVLKLRDGRAIEFDRKSQSQVQALAGGIAQLQEAVFPKLRLAWFAGPHKLADVPTPYRHNRIPYVPFWGKREDLTGVPYGLVRSMRSMQDEINARNSKLIALLASKRITMTDGVALDEPDVVRREASKPNAVHVLDAAKLQQGGVFKVETDFALSQQQYQALVDKRTQLKNVAGVYPSFEGANSNANSGIAIQSLVEQSTQTLSDINDNYRFGRAGVGELLLDLIIEDMGHSPEEVEVEVPGKQPKIVRLNEEIPIDPGVTGISNSVQQARLKVALADVPSTASYRTQRLMMLTELTKSLPPQIQALVIDFVMASTDLPERDAIIERLRTKLGLDDGQQQGQIPQTPEQLQQFVAQHVQQALEQAGVVERMKKLSIEDRKAAVAEADAETRRLDSQTRRLAVENADEHKTLEAGLAAASIPQVSPPQSDMRPDLAGQPNVQPPAQPSDTGLGASEWSPQ
jgi:hypothetical protein